MIRKKLLRIWETFLKSNRKEPISKYIFFISLYSASVFCSLAYSISIDQNNHDLFSGAFIILLGCFFGDLVSGIVHFLLDNWPLRKLEPYLDRVSSLNEVPQDTLKQSSFFAKLGLDFRLHHKHMTDILTATPEDLLFNVLKGDAVLTLLAFLLNFLIFHSPFFGYITCLSSIFVLFVQYVHKWSHTQNNNKAIKFLQKFGIIISVKKHAQHHLDTRYNYSLLNGWSNFLINGIVRLWKMHPWKI
jgi:hypothetical protein